MIPLPVKEYLSLRVVYRQGKGRYGEPVLVVVSLEYSIIPWPIV